MNINTQTPSQMKATVVDILTKAKEQGVVAFIGGGYVRDTILNKPIKDVDVFTLVNEDYLLELDLGHSDNYGGSGANIRDDVAYIQKFTNADVDVICMYHESIEGACYSFDCSICQCYAILNEEGVLELYVSEDFKVYLDSDVIYFYSDIDTSDSHTDRIHEKFPDAIFEKKLSGEIGNVFSKWEG
jgi:hypothetical protein